METPPPPIHLVVGEARAKRALEGQACSVKEKHSVLCDFFKEPVASVLANAFPLNFREIVSKVF